MSVLDPAAITAGDLCTQALKECGAWGVGQTPLGEDISDAQFRLQTMLQQWERKRWMVYHLVDLSVISNGSRNYTVGPGGQISTGTNANSVRPERVESAFLRQLVASQPNQIDYPLELLQSWEDYSQIALKGLVSFPGALFYDSAWPLGRAYPWPVPQANIYELHLVVREQLPPKFATSSTIVNLPYEYFGAILYNLALRLRPKYGLGSYPGDMVPGLAKDGMNVVRAANTSIARLRIPADLNRPGIYNIFSDRSY